MPGTVSHWRFLAIEARDDRAGARRDAVAELGGWFAAPTLGERAFVHQWAELAEDPTEAEVRARLGRVERDADWSEDTAVVVVLLGRSFTSGGVQYVLLRDSDTSAPDATALRIFDLLSWLGRSAVRHLAVLIDLDEPVDPTEFESLLSREDDREWLVVAANRGSGGRGGLLDALGSFVRHLHSAEGRRYGEGPFISVSELLEDLQHLLDPDVELRVARSSGLDGPFVCLPNPHHGQGDVVPLRRSLGALAISVADLEAHWGPRSRGVAVNEDGGWLFSGRAHLMRTLLAAAVGRPGVTIVTGGAGSGKSAALARLVTLSDSKFVGEHGLEVASIPEALRPPVGSVDAAVLGTGKLPVQILEELCDHIGVPNLEGDRRVPTVEGLLESWSSYLSTRSGPITVVIDGLDEAQDPDGLVRDVLARLEWDAGSPMVRLILGVRSHAAGDEASSSIARTDSVALVDLAISTLRAGRIAVDELPWWDQADVSSYVESILWNSSASPYPAAGAAATSAVANAVASKAGRSFLIARMAAASLVAREHVIREDDPEWLEALDNGVVGVFREDLRHTFADAADRRRAVVLMRAVAYARGVGLPWRGVWPVVASAVDDGGRHYGDTDIAWLLGSRLGAYLVTDRDGDVTVYRLFHDLLRSTLRDRWRELLQQQQ